MFKTACAYALCTMAIASFPTTLDAFAHGGGGGRGGMHGYPDQFNQRHYVDPNAYWYGANYGVVEGVDAGYPNAGIGAGIPDDSDQLYQSYLNDSGVSGE